jgi:hypothetical protein
VTWELTRRRSCAGCIGEVNQQSIPSKLAVQDRLTRSVEANDVEAVLPDVDAVYRDSFNALFHGGPSVNCVTPECSRWNRSGPSHYFHALSDGVVRWIMLVGITG